ncbi:atonal bHLH transcription factor 8-like protein net [Haematobia irritans]|uniref:atonal bHLH transcription factor 8-like protein net n=1 Tax=Haematobia irritans TaxID=7368 RepID=UPI003F4FEF8A
MAADLSTTTTAAGGKPTLTTSSTENLYMHLNASELTAIIMKGSPHSNDRDAGFCSGSSEGGDDYSMDNMRLAPSTPPTDASDDSVEVKVSPISLVRNKRKSSEPSKVISEHEERSTIASQSNGPLKKRIRYSSTTDSGVVLTPPAVTITSPPPALWDPSQILPHELMPNPAQVFVRHPGVTTLHRLPKEEILDELPQEQEEPLALVLKKKPIDTEEEEEAAATAERSRKKSSLKSLTPKKRFLAHESSSLERSPKQVCLDRSKDKTQEATGSNPNLVPPPAFSLTSSHEDFSLNTSANTTKNSSSSAASGGSSSKPQQRNYKNMTRERRIEANARERSRVHTISAAYETLRQAVPSYSNNQKLSKLSVLRVACSYILTLSRMAGYDYSQDQSEPSIADCFDAVTATIQTEGKIRKKKEDEK